MRPGDIAMYRDEAFGIHRFYEIVAINLGGEKNDGVVEVRPLSRRTGYPHKQTYIVPEPMVRALVIFTPAKAAA